MYLHCLPLEGYILWSHAVAVGKSAPTLLIAVVQMGVAHFGDEYA